MCFFLVKFMYFCGYSLWQMVSVFLTYGTTTFYFKINKSSTIPFMISQNTI